MDIIAYIILALSSVTALVLFFNLMEDDKRSRIRTRILSRLSELRMSASDRTKNSELANLLAGSGLKITAQQYQNVRLAMLLVAVLFALPGLLHKHIYALLLPLLVYVLTDYKKMMPMHFLLMFLQKLQRAKLHHELILLYDLLILYFEAYSARPITLYDILRKTLPNLNKLQVPVLRCLTLWPRDPRAALERFALEVNTEAARDLAQILMEISTSSVSVGLDILMERYSNFEKDRVSYLGVSLYNRTIVGTVLGTAGIAVVGFDLYQIFSQYAANMISMPI